MIRQKTTPEEEARRAKTYARNPAELARLDRAREEAQKGMPALRVEITAKETEIPDGGGKGIEVPYVLELMIDGAPAVTLRRDHFKRVGQMARLIEILEAHKEFPDIGKKSANHKK